MTIETSLCVSYLDVNYEVLIKMIRVREISYFYIRNKNPLKPLLTDDQLQLSYKSSFSIFSFEHNSVTVTTPESIIKVIQEVILDHSKIWFWD